ncbi:MAG: hypothetical protein AAGG72_10535 [Pseudomonadota bacterium]
MSDNVRTQALLAHVQRSVRRRNDPPDLVELQMTIMQLHVEVSLLKELVEKLRASNSDAATVAYVEQRVHQLQELINTRIVGEVNLIAQRYAWIDEIKKSALPILVITLLGGVLAVIAEPFK